MSKEGAKEFSETIKKVGETLKQDMTRKGLDKDPSLVKRVEKIDQDCKEASEYVKKRTDTKTG